MKHKVGYAVFYKGILDNKFYLDKIYINADSAIKRAKDLFEMFQYETTVERTWIMED